MVAIVAGPNPHVIMDDGSHYYPGATFLNGSILRSISPNGIILTTKTERSNYPGAALLNGNDLQMKKSTGTTLSRKAESMN
jgi:hypothetical protein